MPSDFLFGRTRSGRDVGIKIASVRRGDSLKKMLAPLGGIPVKVPKRDVVCLILNKYLRIAS